MDFGLGIYNPGGELVASSVSQGYRYLGQAYIVQQSVKQQYNNPTPGESPVYGDLVPYLLRIQMPNANDVPILGVELHGGAVTIDGYYHLGGGLWEIRAYSCTYQFPTDFISIAQVVVQPIKVHVWAPYSEPSGYGLVVYTASGQVAFNSAQKPLIIKQVFNVAQYDYSWVANTWTPNITARDYVLNGRAETSAQAVKPVVITNAYGADGVTSESSGNTLGSALWGWSLTNGTLYRRRFCTFRYFATYDQFNDGLSGRLYPGTVMIVEGNGL